MFDADRWNEIDDSSLIKALGAKDGWLIVQFHKGEMYRYPNAAHHMDDLVAAESVGKHFHCHVRDLLGYRINTDDWPG